MFGSGDLKYMCLLSIFYRILPSKAQTYTLRDVLPESDEAQKDVEPLVGSGAKRNNTHTVGVNSPELGDERGSISPEGEYLVHPS